METHQGVHHSLFILPATRSSQSRPANEFFERKHPSLISPPIHIAFRKYEINECCLLLGSRKQKILVVKKYSEEKCDCDKTYLIWSSFHWRKESFKHSAEPTQNRPSLCDRAFMERQTGQRGHVGTIPQRNHDTIESKLSSFNISVKKFSTTYIYLAL